MLARDIDWSRGYKARFYATTVNPNTWYDDEQFEIVSGSVSNTNSGLRNSAEYTFTEDTEDIERLVRIYVDAVQGQDISHEAVFTGYATSPTVDIDGEHRTRKASCYSVLKPADDVLLPRGWYAPKGKNSAKVVQELLSVSPAPFEPIPEDDEFINAPRLTKHMLAEDGETCLSMADKIATAVGWYIRIRGDGTIVFEEPPVNDTEQFEPYEMDIVEPTLSITRDMFNVPNVYRVVMEDASRIARDDDENSIYSTVNRGREVWAEENGVSIVEGDTLEAYAKRRLKEAQKVGTEISYSRAFVPDIRVGDIISMRYAAVDGRYRVTSQKIEFGHAIRTSEQAVRLDTDIVFKEVARHRAIIVMPDGVIIVLPNDVIPTFPVARRFE